MSEVERGLSDLFAEEIAAEDEVAREHQEESATDHKEGTSEKTKDVAATTKAKASPRQSYFYQSRSTYNGHDYVEEHRERVTDADGEHTTLRRRLGDRWYETETHTDKDGKSTSKETWHNVPEESIEAFKKEWDEKHGEKYAAVKHEVSPPAVEHKPESQEKKEESQ